MRADGHSKTEIITAGLLRFGNGIPRLAIALAPAASQRILVYGAIAPALEVRLRQACVRLTFCPSVRESLLTLAWQDFDAVLVAPELPGAIELVKALKLQTHLRDVDPELVPIAARRQSRTPTFILPLTDDDQYAVILRAPDLAFLENEGHLALVDAVLRLDADALESWFRKR